jgi:hypothetical protein
VISARRSPFPVRQFVGELAAASPGASAEVVEGGVSTPAAWAAAWPAVMLAPGVELGIGGVGASMAAAAASASGLGDAFFFSQAASANTAMLATINQPRIDMGLSLQMTVDQPRRAPKGSTRQQNAGGLFDRRRLSDMKIRAPYCGGVVVSVVVVLEPSGSVVVVEVVSAGGMAVTSAGGVLTVTSAGGVTTVVSAVSAGGASVFWVQADRARPAAAAAAIRLMVFMDM